MIRSECESVRELLFAYLEDEVSSDERHLISEHLDHCGACRRELDKEQELTSRLMEKAMTADGAPRTSPLSKPNAKPASANAKVGIAPQRMVHELKTGRSPRGRMVRRVGTLIACAAALVLVATLWNNLGTSNEQAAYGSVVSQRLIVGGAESKPQEQELEASNSIRLPSGASAKVDLNGGGEIEVVGPAHLELDHVGDGWKLTLITGRISIFVFEDHPITVSTRQDTSRLAPGSHIVDADVGVAHESEPGERDTRSPAELLDAAFHEFYSDIAFSGLPDGDSSMHAAAELLKQAANHPDATDDQRNQATFYLAAALSNTQRHEEAIEVATGWLLNEQNELSDTMMSICGDAYWALGRQEEAVRMWARLLEHFPDSVYAPYFIDRYEAFHGSDQSEQIRNRPSAETNEPADHDTTESIDARPGNANNERGAYMVVATALPDAEREPSSPYAGFAQVANEIAEYHDAELIAFDGADFESLAVALHEQQPENVLFVIPPDRLDVNLHRQILLISPTLDADRFVDFAFGYFTAEDTAGLQAFWQRTKALHEEGMTGNTWVDTSVVGSGLESSRTSGGPYLAAESGFKGESLQFGIVDADPNVLNFVTENLRVLESANVISMTGNGDPQGIWLFDGSRNLDSSFHWPFDPQRVGSDPEGVMPRIVASRFRELNLQSPVIWSGTCHSGATQRVYVEGDIVSTFGTSEEIEVYDLTPDESLCLSMISAGAGAMLVPIASNHGYSTLNESLFAVRFGATLGEILKSTYDDVCLQAGGRPSLMIVKPGDPHHFGGEHVMQGGGANRILIGDPSLKLFEPTSVGSESTELIRAEPERIEVQVQWLDGFHPWGWNIYGEARRQEIRMYTRLPWPEDLELPVDGVLEVEVDVTTPDGRSIRHDAIGTLELFHGRTYLHLQATTTDSSVHYKARTARFEVTW